MRCFKLYMSFLVLAAMLVSCKKYLDIKKTSTQHYLESADDCQRVLDRYDEMNSNYPSDGEASSDDYFLGVTIYPAGLSEDDRDLYTWSSRSGRVAGLTADQQWMLSYRTVYNANMILESLDGDKVRKTADAATLANLRGSALFFRAYAFWSIAQLYAKPFGPSAATDPGIPLRTSSDINDVFGRASVQQTYDRITADLMEAAGLLRETSLKPTRPNKAAAYAMLSRVYLSMEDYPKALTNATVALQLNHRLVDFNSLNPDSEKPFERFNDEVIFHSLSSPTALLDRGWGYGQYCLIEPSLYAQYETNDLRKTVFFNESISDVDGVTKLGTFHFTGNYEPDVTSILFNGLAVDELYLIRAECYARADNKGQAMADLNTLLASRWKKVAGVSTYQDRDAGNAQQALEMVLAERRKELVMRGTRWTDLRRLNKDDHFKVQLNRKDKGDGAVIAVLPPNDPRYTLLIPQEVITNARMEQNRR